MYRNVYDLKAFYNSRTGRVVRRIMQNRIRKFWPDVTGMSVMGSGYATPYLRIFKEEAERVFAVMPAPRGVHHWPQTGHEKNVVLAAEAFALPLESSSVDRILLMHDLEFSEMLHPNLQEIWRVMKPNGRLLVVVPNRSGLWSSADWSPFGLGKPYSETQLCYYLRENNFVHERSEQALFLPPSRRGLMLKSAALFERFGPYCLPFFAGLHMVEATKQVFATLDKGSGSRVAIRGRGGIARPVTEGYGSFQREKK